jgi:hypothetical protein
MVGQAHHERFDSNTIRPELVKGGFINPFVKLA